MTDRVLASFNRNGRETLRVAISRFKGNTFIDVRNFAISTSGETVPTRSGITLQQRMLRGVIEALEAAERELTTGDAE